MVSVQTQGAGPGPAWTQVHTVVVFTLSTTDLSAPNWETTGCLICRPQGRGLSGSHLLRCSKGSSLAAKPKSPTFSSMASLIKKFPA